MNHSRQQNPVLLVHGLWDTGTVFRSMRDYLTNLGWVVYDLDMTPNNGDSKLEHLAEQVEDYIERTFDQDMTLDVIGYSMGGIVSRYYIQRMGGIQRVKRFITLAAPHNGTWTAYGSQRPGCAQMRPSSTFLDNLNQDIAVLSRINFTSIWTPFDAMILPANSSQVAVGKEIKVWVPAHQLMVSDLKSLRTVATALAEPIRE